MILTEQTVISVRQQKKQSKFFQKDHDLTVTGEVDQETAGTLESSIIEKIRSGEDDKQLEKALEVVH